MPPSVSGMPRSLRRISASLSGMVFVRVGDGMILSADPRVCVRDRPIPVSPRAIPTSLRPILASQKTIPVAPGTVPASSKRILVSSNLGEDRPRVGESGPGLGATAPWGIPAVRVFVPTGTSRASDTMQFVHFEKDGSFLAMFVKYLINKFHVEGNS